MKRTKLLSGLLCGAVLTACLTVGASAATLEDHVYRDDYTAITNVVSYDENYTASQGGPGVPVNCVAPVRITPTNPDAVYWIENLMGEGQYAQGSDITAAGIEITEAGEYAVSFDVSSGGGDGYTGGYYLIVGEGSATGPSIPVSSGKTFSDVAADAYYADAVTWAVEKGITSGTGDGTTFSPDATCTTAQILTFLWRANGSPTPAGKDGSVPDGQYYSDAANWALEQGLTDAFHADTPATRADTVTYLWKLAGQPEAKDAAFVDVDQNAEYAAAVAWAVEQGITSGTGNGTTFSPDATCTRGQIVTFLHRDLAE